MRVPSFNWECPYCERHQVVTDANCEIKEQTFTKTNMSSQGMVGISIRSIVCSNEECKKVTLAASLHPSYLERLTGGYALRDQNLEDWNLMPSSHARQLPDFIPQPLVEDYNEACLIKDLSPKASATLARRCLQGMIRDFCGISRDTLINEIKTLEEMAKNNTLPTHVNADSIGALHDIRKIGNVGAHMEKDINIIVDVEPEEAQALITLVETLFDEWYIEKNKRTEKFKKLSEVSKKIEERKKPIVVSQQDDSQDNGELSTDEDSKKIKTAE